MGERGSPASRCDPPSISCSGRPTPRRKRGGLHLDHAPGHGADRPRPRAAGRPLDLDAATLAPTAEALDEAIGPATRVVVVAHLFGGRIDLAPIAAHARAQGALLVEDCAQALRGPADHGDTLADVSLFSFGAIKTATALGGALVRIADPQLRAAVVDAQRRRPRQARPEQLAKLLKFSGLLLVGRPLLYGLLLRALALAGRDADAFVNGVVKAFPSGAVALDEHRTARLLDRVRRSPSAPLLALVRRRLRRFDHERLARRAAFGELASAALPHGLVHAGRLAADRTHCLPGARGRPGRPGGGPAGRGRRRREGNEQHRGDRRTCGCPGSDAARGSGAHASDRLRPPSTRSSARPGCGGTWLPFGAQPPRRRACRRSPTSYSCQLGAKANGAHTRRYPRAVPLRDLDLLVVGAGIVGSRVAYEAAPAGMRVALVDAGDFGSGTSSTSSKLVHGGLRYLATGQLRLVRQAQRERRLLEGSIAPSLVWPLPLALTSVRGGTSRALLPVAIGAYRALAGPKGTFGSSGEALRAVAPGSASAHRSRALRSGRPREPDERRQARARHRGRSSAGGADVANYVRLLSLEQARGRIVAGLLEGLPDEGLADASLPRDCQLLGAVDRPCPPPRGSRRDGLRATEQGRQRPSAARRALGCGSRPVRQFPQRGRRSRHGLLLLGATDSPFDGAPEALAAGAEDVASLLEAFCDLLPGVVLRPSRVLSAFAGLRVLPRADGRPRTLRATRPPPRPGRHGLGCRRQADDTPADRVAALGALPGDIRVRRLRPDARPIAWPAERAWWTCCAGAWTPTVRATSVRCTGAMPSSSSRTVGPGTSSRLPPVGPICGRKRSGRATASWPLGRRRRAAADDTRAARARRARRSHEAGRRAGTSAERRAGRCRVGADRSGRGRERDVSACEPLVSGL